MAIVGVLCDAGRSRARCCVGATRAGREAQRGRPGRQQADECSGAGGFTTACVSAYFSFYGKLDRGFVRFVPAKVLLAGFAAAAGIGAARSIVAVVYSAYRAVGMKPVDALRVDH